MARGPAMRRQPSLWRRLDTASRWIFPGAMLLFGLFLIGMPFGIPGQAELRPVYAMACVFFWSLYRPASLPAPFVAVTGLLLDLLSVSPLGLWAILLLLLQWASIALRRSLVPAKFLITWGVFISFASVAAWLAWMVQSALYRSPLPLWPAWMEILLAAGLYPALAACLVRAHRGPAAVELA